MSYLGLGPKYKVFSQSKYKATGGELKLPMKVGVELILIKNGSILDIKDDYDIDTDNYVLLYNEALPGDEYTLMNLATFNFSGMATKEEIAEIRKEVAKPLYEVTWYPSRDCIPDGEIPADGQLLLRELFPGAFKGIEERLVPITTEAIWLGDKRYHASYTLGDGSTNFRIPDYNGKHSKDSRSLFLRGDGGGADSAGIIQEDAIREMTGVVAIHGSGEANIINGLNGVFEAGPPPHNKYRTPAQLPINDGAGSYGTITFRASRVVPTAEENRSVNTAGVYCIRLFNAVAFEGRINAAALATEVGKLNSEVQQLNSKLSRDKWYLSNTPEFQSRFEPVNDWIISLGECMMKETENEIRFKGIIRRNSLSTEKEILKVKNPRGDRLICPYTPMICNAINSGGGFVSIYAEHINVKSDTYFSMTTSGAPSVSGWVMVEFTISKNPGGV